MRLNYDYNSPNGVLEKRFLDQNIRLDDGTIYGGTVSNDEGLSSCCCTDHHHHQILKEKK